MKTKTLIFLIFLFYLIAPVITYAGDINSYEQSIIDSLKTDFKYNGKKYIADDKYITKITNYLMQDDIDFNSQEAAIYKNTLLNNIPACIKEGYLILADNPTKAPTTVKPTKEVANIPSEDSKPDTTSTPVTNPPTIAPTSTPTNEPTAKPTVSVEIPSPQNIKIHDSAFTSFLGTYLSIFVILFFIGIALTYVLINKKELVNLVNIFKIISLSICLSLFISSALIKFLFLNTDTFERNLNNCGYYEYIEKDISSHIMRTYNFEWEQDFQLLLLKERFSEIRIHDDIYNYNNSSTDRISVDSVHEDIMNIVYDYTKETNESWLPITNDKFDDWIYNVSDYYVNSIEFSCAKAFISNANDVSKYLNVILILTGITILIYIIYLFTSRKNNMLTKLKCLVSSMLFTLPTLLGFIEYSNKNNLFSPTNGLINSNIHSHIYKLHEIRVFESFNNICINYFFYFLTTYLIVILAIHYLVKYYFKKYN